MNRADVKSLDFSPDGHFLATVADDFYLTVFDAVCGDCESRVLLKQKFLALSWHPRTNIIALACEDRSNAQNFLKFAKFQ